MAGEATRPALPESLDALFAEQLPFVWRSLRRLGVRAEQLDDAVQDVFVVALRRATDFRGMSSTTTWLFGIAHNVAREYARKSRRASEFEPIEETHLAPGPSPLDGASSAEALSFVDAFLRSLDEDKRAVFVLAELERLSAPEIAEALGVKLNTVYSRLRAARSAFNDRVQRLAGEP